MIPGESREGDMSIELNVSATPLCMCSLYEGTTHTHLPVVWLFVLVFFRETQINTRQCCFISARVNKRDNKSNRPRKPPSIR